MGILGESIKVPAAGNRNEQVAKWAKKLNRGIKKRDEEVGEWDKNRDFVFPKKKSQVVTADTTQVNKLKSWIEGRISALAFYQPHINLTPEDQLCYQPVRAPKINPDGTPVMDQYVQQDPMTGSPMVDPMTGQPVMGQQPAMGMIPRYKVLEAVTNKIVSDPKFESGAMIGRLVQSGHLSMGVTKAGYCADFETPEEEPEPVHVQNLLFFDQAVLKKSFMFAKDGTPLFDDDGFLIPLNREPISERWFVDWVNPRRMIFDPNGENSFSEHEWVACEYLRSLADVKADPLFKNTKDLRGVSLREDEDESEEASKREWGSLERQGGSESSGDNDDELMVRLIEIFDLKHRRIIVLADNHGDFLRNDPFPDGVDPDGPYSFYRYHEREGQWYHEPPATGLRAINDWYNKANDQAMQELRKTGDKVVYDTRFFSPEAGDKLISPLKEAIGVDMAKASAAGMSINQIVMALPIPSRAMEFVNYAGLIAKNFDEQAAQPSDTRVANTGTATQASLMDGRLQVREDSQRGRLAATLRDAYSKLVASIQANMTKDVYLEYTDEDGSIMPITVTPDMICDIKCKVSVSVEDMAPQNKMQSQMNMDRWFGHLVSLPLMGADPEVNEAMAEIYDIRDKRLTKGLPQIAMQWMAMNAPQPQAQGPGGDPAGGEADAASKRGEAF